MFIRGRAGLIQMTHPEMDVNNARLDYAATNAERTELLGQLLGKYDQLVEMAEVRKKCRGYLRNKSMKAN